MEKFMTKQEREKLSNKLVLNFGILLCGALIMLYVYNFISAGYVAQTQNTLGIIAIVSLVLAIVFFTVGKAKNLKIKNYSALFLGIAIAGFVTYLPKLIPAFAAKTAVICVFLLMLLYFIVLATIIGITLKTHPEAPKAKNIQHKKKKRK